MKVVEDDYKFLSHTPFVFERGFPTMAINFGDLLQGIWSWSKLCEHPPLGVALVVREFCTNLQDKVGSTIFVQWKWVLFDASTINRVFGLTNADSKKFIALYREPNYELVLEELTDGSAPWTRNENQEVMSFSRLKEVAKVWFYHVSSKLVPSKYLSTIGRDEALLTFAIVKGYKFKVGKVIKNSI